jgi:hypothetical protein
MPDKKENKTKGPLSKRAFFIAFFLKYSEKGDQTSNNYSLEMPGTQGW